MSSVRQMLLWVVGLLCVVVALSGCNDCDCPTVPETPPPTLEELLGAPDTLVVDSLRLVLSTFLWRDFMPFAPPDGRPLIGILTLSELDQQPIPRDVHIPTAWVVNAGELWEASPTPRDYHGYPAPLDKLVVRIGDGPKWGPYILVDVVIRVAVGTGRTLLLRAPDQWIERTD